MEIKSRKWILGLAYLIAVASIWIAASFVVQSVIGGGVSPFLITYICNSLFIVYIPLVEISRYLEDSYGGLLFWKRTGGGGDALPKENESEESVLLSYGDLRLKSTVAEGVDDVMISPSKSGLQIEKGRWTRMRVAKISLLICPFWFLAQLTFNFSLKYTTVTSNTILSSMSSLFTFLVSLSCLGEKFTWVKLVSVLLCMTGTIVVSLGDTQSVLISNASRPLLGDILSIISAALYAVYITLIRIKIPDEEDETRGAFSIAQFLGFLGLFNLLIFLPFALALNFTKLEPFSVLSWRQLGLVIGKGLLDNVLSDYLWAKAVVLTTTTVATAGLSIQVPLAAVVDSLTGRPPNFMDCLGAIAVIVGFVGINLPSAVSQDKEKIVVEDNVE